MSKIVIVGLVIYFTIGLILGKALGNEKVIKQVFDESEEIPEEDKDLLKSIDINWWVVLLQILYLFFWPLMIAAHYIMVFEDYIKAKKNK